MVLVGGLGDDSASWQNQITSLSHRFRVTAVDNRGVGGTYAPGKPHTVAEMALDLAAVLQELGVTTAHLVGNSMGAASSKSSLY